MTLRNILCMNPWYFIQSDQQKYDFTKLTHLSQHPFELVGMYSSIVKPRSWYIILTYSFAFTLFNFE